MNSNFFEDLKNGLLEAVEIEKGNIQMQEKENMPAKTYVVKSEIKKETEEKYDGFFK